ncbi:helix-turn-helix domain-containing protein [Azohydromonas australica]|uniref:helix-turn-helix domain-containing protein n=1 Tax=Azohydromonas australica TaxID=364039 RepID=UPI0012EBBF2E|nr:helix-turn-helix domain-containing protein [Azohydromonas australica]
MLPLPVGVSIEQTAAVLGVSVGSACQLRRRFISAGPDGLAIRFLADFLALAQGPGRIHAAGAMAAAQVSSSTCAAAWLACHCCFNGLLTCGLNRGNPDWDIVQLGAVLSFVSRMQHQ